MGRITSSTKEGLWVSLEFFDEVFIPSYLLQQPSEWREETKSWLWNYSEDEGADEFTMQVGEQVRFKVRTMDFNRVTTTVHGGKQVTTTSETYNSSSSSANNGSGVGAMSLRRGNSDLGDAESSTRRQRSSSSIGISAGSDDNLPSVMKVIGSCNEEGLGLVSWWSSS